MIVIACLLLWCLPSAASAQAPAAANEPPQKTVHELRREWIASQAPKLFTNQADLREFLARLPNLNEFEVNELANEVLGQLDARRNQQGKALRQTAARDRAAQAEWEARVAEQALQQQAALNFFPPPPPVIGFVRDPYSYYFPPAFFPPPVVGYFPVVAWLPAGVSMSASAVISPDGRSVRTSIMPFFSTIGPVHTFNYSTGETRRLPQYDPPRRDPRPVTPTYDGLRTRNDEYRRN